MQARLLFLSVVLAVGLVGGGCRDNGAGTGSDGGTDMDGGGGHDAGGDGGGLDGGGGPDADGGGEEATGCDVAAQRGCDAGALCLRGLTEDGGQGNVCFPGECDLVKQDCPSGNKCTYVLEGSVTRRRCVSEVSGAVGEGSACETQLTPGGGFYDTCKAGLYCTDRRGTDGSTAFTCQRFCYGAAQCTAPRECSDTLRFTGSSELPRVCGEPGPTCDLLAQGCGGTLGCYPSTRSTAVCVTAGAGTEGAACTYSNDCGVGSVCVKGGSGQVCRRLCRSPSGSPTCASGQCEPLQDFPGVGACLP